MAIVCAGVDLAKHVFAIHGVDAVGNAVLGATSGAMRQATRGIQPSAVVFDRLGNLLWCSAPGSSCHRLNQRGQ